MSKTANVNIAIDPTVASDVEIIYARYGMSLSDAVSVFFHATRHMDGLPFDLRQPATEHIPNDDSLAAIEEGNQIIKSGKGRFASADALLKELKA